MARQRLRYVLSRSLDRLPQVRTLSPEERFGLRVVSEVFPFRTNLYVVEELIDWGRGFDDPMMRLHFPHRDMLDEDSFSRMADAVRRGAPAAEREAVAGRIRRQLNPQPGGQTTANVPLLDGRPVPGVQHKYRETVLVFPAAGQCCHAYCTYCFRWAQFVDRRLPKLATDRDRTWLEYMARHPEVSDVLITGGDPMTMSAGRLAAYVEPLLGPAYSHVRTVRIGTKSVAHWPYRFVSDRDSEDVLRLFERVVRAGKHLALMGHYSHHRELSTEAAREAIRRIRGTGAVIRTQSPVIRGVNDEAEIWSRLWREQVRLGCVPYYMFVARNTGADRHFSLTLDRALRVYRGAIDRLSGLGRTARGPVMSATPGKLHLLGKARLGGERVFLLTMLQARVPEHVGRPFFARYDPDATWLTDLHPAFGAERFPFERRSRESPSPLDRAAGSRFGTARVRPARCGGGRGRRLDDSERGRASGPAAGWREPGGAD